MWLRARGHPSLTLSWAMGLTVPHRRGTSVLLLVWGHNILVSLLPRNSEEMCGVAVWTVGTQSTRLCGIAFTPRKLSRVVDAGRNVYAKPDLAMCKAEPVCLFHRPCQEGWLARGLKTKWVSAERSWRQSQLPWGWGSEHLEWIPIVQERGEDRRWEVP